MGKNQQHKAAQRSRHGGGDGDAPDLASGDGVDVSFHTPEWHAARCNPCVNCVQKSQS